MSEDKKSQSGDLFIVDNSDVDWKIERIHQGCKVMEQLNMEKAKQILGDLECRKGLLCVKRGLEDLCRARDTRLETYLECLEEGETCPFSIPFGHGFLCKCPVRMYIKRELGN